MKTDCPRCGEPLIVFPGILGIFSGADLIPLRCPNGHVTELKRCHETTPTGEKTHPDAYRIPAAIGLEPSECLMVTANPTFGDIEEPKPLGCKPE